MRVRRHSICLESLMQVLINCGRTNTLCVIYSWVFSATHILGHSMNFYSISTQPPGDVTCLFRDYYRASHILATFHYWAFQTITGITGVILTVIAIVM